MNNENDIRPSDFFDKYKKEFPDEPISKVRNTIIRNVKETAAPEKPKISDYKRAIQNLNYLLNERPEYVKELVGKLDNINSLIGIMEPDKALRFEARIADLLDSEDLFSNALIKARHEIETASSIADVAFQIAEIIERYLQEAINSAFRDEEIKSIFSDDPVLHKAMKRLYLGQYTLTAREFVALVLKETDDEISDYL